MPSPVGHTLGAFAAMLAIDPPIIATRHKITLQLVLHLLLEL